MSSNLTPLINAVSPILDLVTGSPVSFAITACVLYYVISSTIAWSRLRHFSGPPLASFSYLWGFFSLLSGRFHTILVEQQEKYGKVMRVAPDGLMIYDPEMLWQINSARSAYNRGDWYEGIRLNPEGHSVFSELNTATHDKIKSKLSFGFSGKGLMNIERDVDSQIAALISHIKSKLHDADGNSNLDFGRIIRLFQVDFITLASMGETWGDLASETDHFDFISAMDQVQPFFHSISVIPLLRQFVFTKVFLYFAGPKTTDKYGLGKALGKMQSAVNSRFQEEESKKSQHGDMLGEWIKHGVPPEACEFTLSIMMPAGVETSITAIRGTLLFLISSPHVYQKLKQEIRDGIKQGRVSNPITNDEAKNLSYLQAVIYEGMRMLPPVIAGFPKKVPPGGDTICGKFVPGGTDIYCNFVTMMRYTDVFGSDVDIFRPERFLECDAVTKKRMLKTVDLVFGFGRWLCLGKSVAQTELNKVFVELLRVFDFQITNPETPWHRKGYSTFLIDDFKVRVLECAID